jgi:hypothetical protein
MKKTIALLVTVLISSLTTARAADLYFDMNGTDAGFNVTSTNDPFEVNFTNATWNTDSTGGAGGVLTTVSNGDVLHFGLEHTGGILFNWTYFTNAAVGGIHTYQTAGSTAGINRFQKNNDDGLGLLALNWAPGATFETEKACSLWWNLSTSGDFEKIGTQWLIFADGGPKVNGTCTISTNNVIVRHVGTVSANSSFKLNGGQLRFKGGLTGNTSIGTLSGNGKVDRDSTGDLTGLTIYTEGFDMVNGSAGDLIAFDRGPDVVLSGTATTALEINKSSGTNYSDTVKTWWAQSDFTYNGTLDVTLLAGSEAPTEGDTFQIVEKNSSATFFGSFSSISLPDLGDPDLDWNTSTLASDGTISVITVNTNAPADLYLDLNGTLAGFGVNSTVSPISVDPTLPIWNTDSTGGAGGVITTVNNGDILHFGLEGSDSILFNWTNYTGIVLGGIHTYQTLGSTANINRFQKNNADGTGFQTFSWAASNVTFNTEEACGLWWNLGTIGDFEKVGGEWLILGDGGPKINGTCTISSNSVIVLNTSTVNANSSFKLNGGQLRFNHNIDSSGPTTANLGTLSGSGEVTRDGGTNNLSNLTLNLGGVDMTDGTATNNILLAWGMGATLASGGTTALEINKSGAATEADRLEVDWTSSTLTYGGDLVVSLLGGSDTLAAGDSFDLFSDNTAGAFDTITLPDLGDPGLVWSTTLLASSGIVSVAVADTNAPSAPTGLSAVTNVYTVELDWNDNPEPTVTGYRVYRSTSSVSNFVEIADVATSGYIDTTPNPNDITYYYRVTAYNFVDAESALSDPEAVFLQFALRNGDFELPAIVSGGTEISDSGDWVQNGSAQQIQHSPWATETGDQGVWLKGFTPSVTNSFYQDRDAAAGLDYSLDAGFKIESNFIANGGQLEMALVWLDGGGSEIDRDTLDVDSALGVTDWTHTDIVATAPAGTATVRSWFSFSTTTNANNGSGGKSSMVDNVSLTRFGTPPVPDFSIVSIVIDGTGLNATVTWESAAGATYQVLGSPALNPASWSIIAADVPSDGDGTTSASLPTAPGTQFYRIEGDW